MWKFVALMLVACSATTNFAQAQTLTTRQQDPVATNFQQDAKISSLEALANSIEQTYTTLEPDIRANTDQLRANRSALDDLRRQLDEIKTEIERLKTENARIRSDLTQCEKERSAFQAAYSSCMQNPPCPVCPAVSSGGGRR